MVGIVYYGAMAWRENAPEMWRDSSLDAVKSIGLNVGPFLIATTMQQLDTFADRHYGKDTFCIKLQEEIKQMINRGWIPRLQGANLRTPDFASALKWC